MSLCLSPPVDPEERGTRTRSQTRAHLPWSWTARRRTRSERSWTPDAEDVCCSIWSIGRATASRKGHGLTPRTSWILHSPQTFTELIRIDWHLVPEEDLGVGLLLASGAARRGGALSWIRPLWLSPMATGGHPPEGGVLTPSRTSFPINPSAADYLPRCGSSPGLFNQRPQSHSLRSLVLAPADISERLPILLIVSSVFNPGLPYLGTLNLCLWPRLLPGIVYVSALPLIFLFLPTDHCLFDSASV